METSSTFNLTTYTQTPDCGYTLTYTYSVDDVLNQSPDWFTFNDTSLSIAIYTTNVSFAGTHNVIVTTSYAALNFSETN